MRIRSRRSDEVSRRLGGAKPDEEALSAVYSITK
jgi:hypothetical protein